MGQGDWLYPPVLFFWWCWKRPFLNGLIAFDRKWEGYGTKSLYPYICQHAAWACANPTLVGTNPVVFLLLQTIRIMSSLAACFSLGKTACGMLYGILTIPMIAGITNHATWIQFAPIFAKAGWKSSAPEWISMNSGINPQMFWSNNPNMMTKNTEMFYGYNPGFIPQQPMNPAMFKNQWKFQQNQGNPTVQQ